MLRRVALLSALLCLVSATSPALNVVVTSNGLAQLSAGIVGPSAPSLRASNGVVVRR
jgi:hypothetical protein